MIVATGANAKRLRLPHEDEYWSKGISACAICDGASPLFKGQVLAVVGGGDTATEEAIYLTKYARHVHLLVRRSELRASKAMQDRSVLMYSFMPSCNFVTYCILYKCLNRVYALIKMSCGIFYFFNCVSSQF